MSADVLRRAAALMRERATFSAAGVGARWHLAENGQTMVEDETGSEVVHYDGVRNQSDAEHIASWPPAVALAVAKAMDDVALAWEICDDGWTRDLDDDAIRFEDTVDGGWLNVARAYLGEGAA